MNTYNPIQNLYQHVKKTDPKLFETLDRLNTYMQGIAPAINDLADSSSQGNIWRSPIFYNGWTQAGSPFAVAQYASIAGRTYFKGAIQAGTIIVGTVLFTLDFGFCPKETFIFTTSCAPTFGGPPAIATVSVYPTGPVVLEGSFISGSNFLYLDGISFSLT